MTTVIRYEELPLSIPLQMWTEGDDTIIVINSSLPARKRSAAIRAALRASRTHPAVIFLATAAACCALLGDAEPMVIARPAVIASQSAVTAPPTAFSWPT